MHNKVFIIGIDGGEWSLLKPLMKQGIMPNLSNVVKSGLSGNLTSTIPPLTAPAWASFQTGVNPGKHGIFDFLGSPFPEKEDEREVIDSTSLQYKTVWDYASQNSNRVVLINLPLTYPPKKINGAMIAGVLSPSTRSTFTYPATLYRDLVNEIGDYRIVPDNLDFITKGRKTVKTTRRIVKELSNIVEKRKDAALYLMNKEPWDLFMVHFQATDWLQHGFWSLIDEDNQEFNKEIRNEAIKFYKKLDDCIGELWLEKGNFDKDITTFIVSDHGFGGNHSYIYLNNWLNQKGFLVERNRKGLNFINSLTSFLMNRGIPLIKKIDMFDLLRFAPKSKLIRKFNLDLSVNWNKTEAFAFGTLFFGYIYLPQKFSKPANKARYEKIRQQLIEELSKVVIPGTKQKAIDRIYKKEEIYKGSRLGRAPDLIVKPVDGYHINHIFDQGPLFRESALKGTHREKGIIVVEGPTVNKNSMIPKKANIVDMAPTLLYLLNISIPKHMDGKVLKEIFTEEFRENRSIEYFDDDESSEQMKLEKDDQEIVKERLENLGYL